MLRQFHTLVFSKKADELESWICETEKLDITEVNSFLAGLKKDLPAVKNGIVYSYNNGLAEGSVNKLKLVKRIMYGRSSFALLKSKLLWLETMHLIFYTQFSGLSSVSSGNTNLPSLRTSLSSNQISPPPYAGV